MLTQASGHIVNISTSLVDHADSKRPAALASLTKGRLAAVTRSLAIEYASAGVLAGFWLRSAMRLWLGSCSIKRDGICIVTVS